MQSAKALTVSDRTQEAFHTNTTQVTNDLIDLVSIIQSLNVEYGKQLNKGKNVQKSSPLEKLSESSPWGY